MSNVVMLSEQQSGGGYNKPVFSLGNKIARLVWTLVWLIFGRLSPAPFFGLRATLLRVFGAKVGKGSRIYPNVKIWAPWLLQVDDVVALANGTEIYNPGGVRLGHHVVISQGAYLCGASHDFNEEEFPMIWKPIVIESYGWICARAIVLPGVVVGEGAVLGAGAVASKNLEDWSVYAGNPSRKVGERKKFLSAETSRSKSGELRT